MMPYGWEGNHRSGITVAMQHRLQWFIHLRAQWSKEGRWAPHRSLDCFKEYGILYLTLVALLLYFKRILNVFSLAWLIKKSCSFCNNTKFCDSLFFVVCCLSAVVMSTGSSSLLWPPCVMGQAIIFCCVVSSFYLSISAISDWMSAILPLSLSANLR